MSKVQDKKMVPDIRFPGFEGEWEFSKAGSLFKNSVSKGFEELQELIENLRRIRR